MINTSLFQTDPERADYSLEAGATRNFEPTRTAEELAKREQKEKELEELNNPMKVSKKAKTESIQTTDNSNLKELIRFFQDMPIIEFNTIKSQRRDVNTSE